MQHKSLQLLLNKKAQYYNHIDFIATDPISIPHQFTQQQDIEIAAFFASILAWGNRKSIISSCKKLMQLMNNKPHYFLSTLHQNKNWEIAFTGFVHRTFNSTDVVHLIKVLHHHYIVQQQNSLETAFTKTMQPNDDNVCNALNGFYDFCFNNNVFINYPIRTQKHIASPQKKSACKRLNMFLRWMVRQDTTGVDFGIWKNIQPHQLVIPMDVHVVNVATKLGLLNTTTTNWQNAVQLTNTLKQFDDKDPVKYDFALFGIGVFETQQLL